MLVAGSWPPHPGLGLPPGDSGFLQLCLGRAGQHTSRAWSIPVHSCILFSRPVGSLYPLWELSTRLPGDVTETAWWELEAGVDSK